MRFVINDVEYHALTKSATYVNGVITINTKIDDNKTFIIKLSADKPEIYSFGDFQNIKGKSSLIANIDGKIYNPYRFDCIDDTRFYNDYTLIYNDFIKDKYIKGNFSLIAYYQTDCASEDPIDILGEFKINL